MTHAGAINTGSTPNNMVGPCKTICESIRESHVRSRDCSRDVLRDFQADAGDKSTGDQGPAGSAGNSKEARGVLAKLCAPCANHCGNSGQVIDQGASKVTTHFEVMAGKFLSHILAGLCLLLIGINWVSISDSRFEILQTLGAMSADRNTESESINRSINEIKASLEARDNWADEIDSELARRAKTRLNREQFVEWADEARRLNPSLTVPVLKAVEDFDSDI